METSHPKLRVIILGSGNIVTDLLIETVRSPHLDCSFFVGRNLTSPGMLKARDLGIRVSDKSVNALLHDAEPSDLVFDATSASAHARAADSARMPIVEVGHGNGLGASARFSGFNKHVERIAKEFFVDPRDVLFELGRHKPVAGQEDLIIQVALQLSTQSEPGMTVTPDLTSPNLN